MDKEEKLFIEIRTDDTALFDDIRNLTLPPKPKKFIDENPEPIILMDSKPSEQSKKKKNKKQKKSVLCDISEDLDFTISSDDVDSEDATQRLMDLEDIVNIRRGDDDDDEDIVKTQKRGYKKLKDGKNEYKKEFAEELTLLYNLLDETSKFAKGLEKDLSSMRTTKVRGVSKYSNDLAELVLSSKTTKLSILKEIAAIKKTVADLAQKSEKSKANQNDESNKNEKIASAYFKNILSHGRRDFIQSLEGSYGSSYDLPAEEPFAYNDNDEASFQRALEERLDGIVNPHRSEEGSKYIEYEKRGVNVEVHKCVDTGEWDFVAVDKFGDVIDDYPVPTKRTAGRMKFSDDGTYCVDSLGRMYKIKEFYLPDDE